MKKTERNRRIAIYIIAAVILIGALYLINNPSITGSIFADNNSTKQYDFSREAYPEYYRLLPPKPPDFDQVKLMWTSGIISDVIEKVNESYWKQPEWFPLYRESFLPVLERIVKENRMAIWSLGLYPTQGYRKINQEWLQTPTITEELTYEKIEIKQDSVVLKNRFWLRAAPGTAKYYGVKISTSFPDTALFEGDARFRLEKGEIKQDPKITEQYIKAWVDEPAEFNLGVYFPILESEYIKEVWLNVEINKNTPKGKYIVAVNPGPPSRLYQQEQSLKYGLAYTDPNIGMFANPPIFKIFIEVA